MAVTVSPYNHTTRRFLSGSNASTDTYKVMLCTAATFDATHTTLAGITKTEVASGTGYTTGGQALTGISVSTVLTNGAKFDANDVVWSASSGAIAASYAIVYNDTDADDPPVAFVNFDGSKSAAAGTDFVIVWDSPGIFTLAVA